MTSRPIRRFLPAPLTLLAACAGSGPAPQPTPTPRTYAQNLLGALSGAAIERTRGDMLAIGTAIGAYAAQSGDAPTAEDYAGLARQLSPTFIRVLPPQDAWSRPFRWERRPDGWSLTAPGPDALPGTDDDLVLTDRGFTQLPKGYEPNFAR